MSSLLNKRANDSQTSIDSSRGSEAVLISAAFADSPLAASLHHHSDNDLFGLSNRAAGPGSVQSDMTDEGSTGSRLAGRPAAGWKGRMSSMLLRNPSTSLKADTIKAKKVLLLAHGVACIAWSYAPSLCRSQVVGRRMLSMVSNLNSDQQTTCLINLHSAADVCKSNHVFNYAAACIGTFAGCRMKWLSKM